VTADDLWAPDKLFGAPFKVGEWRYDGRVALAVRLFRSQTLYGSGDEYDDPDDRNDRTVECYYLEFQRAGDDTWGSRRAFLTLDEVDRFGRDELGDTLHWYETR
jgi:hypothetical protein